MIENALKYSLLTKYKMHEYNKLVECKMFFFTTCLFKMMIAEVDDDNDGVITKQEFVRLEHLNTIHTNKNWKK